MDTDDLYDNDGQTDDIRSYVNHIATTYPEGGGGAAGQPTTPIAWSLHVQTSLSLQCDCI